METVRRDVKKRSPANCREVFELMFWMFWSAREKNSNNKYYQFWRLDNHPIELYANQMMDQKLEYIHNNAVEAMIVEKPEYYVFSSAIDYHGRKGLVDIDFLQ